MNDENVLKVKELIDKIEKSKKKPSDEEKVQYMKYWSEIAQNDEYRAIKFLLKSYLYDSSRVIFTYLMATEKKENYERLLNFFIDERSNKDEKTRLAYCKTLFELAAEYVCREEANKHDLASLLQSFDYTYKPEEYFYSSFIQNIPQTMAYPDYSSLGLNYYSAKSLNQYLLKIANKSHDYIQHSFTEKTEFKDDKEKQFYEKKFEQKEEKLRRIGVFIQWISDADSKLVKEEPPVEKREIKTLPENESIQNVNKLNISSENEGSKTEVKENPLTIEKFNELEKTLIIKDSELEKKEDIIFGLSRQIEEYKNQSERNLSRALKSENEYSALTNEINKLKKERDELNIHIISLNNNISSLNKEIEERKNMNDVISSVESKKSDETMKKIANKLKIEYDEFKEAQAVEMSVELGEVLKDIINNIFDKLNKSGIKVE